MRVRWMGAVLLVAVSAGCVGTSENVPEVRSEVPTSARFERLGDGVDPCPTFTGRVLSPSGEPSVDRVVRLFIRRAFSPREELSDEEAASAPRFVRETRTDAAGEYVFERVPPVDQLWLEILDAEGDSVSRRSLGSLGYLGERRLLDPVPLDDLRVGVAEEAGEPWPTDTLGRLLEDVPYKPTPVVRGLVTDLDGRPVADAVVLHWVTGRLDLEVVSITGADGRFELSEELPFEEVLACHRLGLALGGGSESQTGFEWSHQIAFASPGARFMVARLETVELLCHRDGNAMIPNDAELAALRTLTLLDYDYPSFEFEPPWYPQSFASPLSVAVRKDGRVLLESVPALFEDPEHYSDSDSGPRSLYTDLAFPNPEDPNGIWLRIDTPDGFVRLTKRLRPADDAPFPSWPRMSWPDTPIRVAFGEPALRPPREVSVQGTVKDAAGRPVAGATVEMLVNRPGDGRSQVSSMTTTSDAGGRYAFVGIVPFQSVEIAARTSALYHESVLIEDEIFLPLRADAQGVFTADLELTDERLDEDETGLYGRRPAREFGDKEIHDFRVVDTRLDPVLGAVVLDPQGVLLAVTNRDGRPVRTTAAKDLEDWLVDAIQVFSPAGYPAVLEEPEDLRLFDPEDWYQADPTAEGLERLERLRSLDRRGIVRPIYVVEREATLQLRFVHDGKPFDPNARETRGFWDLVGAYDSNDNLPPNWFLEPMGPPGRFALHFPPEDGAKRLSVYSVRSGRLETTGYGDGIVPLEPSSPVRFDTPSGALYVRDRDLGRLDRVYDVVFSKRMPSEPVKR